MSLIPTIRCDNLREAVAFYTEVLDFTRADPCHPLEDPGYTILRRGGGELHLSSHAGDGVRGGAFVVPVRNVDALFRKYVSRGLDPSAKPHSPVHQGPVDQSWGMREFYADDPSGNTVRFVQR